MNVSIYGGRSDEGSAPVSPERLQGITVPKAAIWSYDPAAGRFVLGGYLPRKSAQVIMRKRGIATADNPHTVAQVTMGCKPPSFYTRDKFFVWA